jgi:hypothetical protein
MMAMVGSEEKISVFFSTSTMSSNRVIDQKGPAGLSA